MKTKVLRILGVIVFFAGFAVGLYLHIGTAWADFEAFMFDSQLTADGPLRTLSCPPVIAPGDEGTISATFHNPSDDPVKRRVRVHITQGLASLFREDDQFMNFQPGESKYMEWTVSAEDAAYDRFILVRVYLFRRYPLTSATSTCGVLVLNILGMTGGQIVLAGSLLSLALMAAGISMWALPVKPLVGKARELTFGMSIGGSLVILGILCNVMNWWIPSVLLVILVVLLVFVVLMQFILMD